jgi:hypothetical protein
MQKKILYVLFIAIMVTLLFIINQPSKVIKQNAMPGIEQNTGVESPSLLPESSPQAMSFGKPAITVKNKLSKKNRNFQLEEKSLLDQGAQGQLAQDQSSVLGASRRPFGEPASEAKKPASGTTKIQQKPVTEDKQSSDRAAIVLF